MRALIPFLSIWMGCGDAITAKGTGSDADADADSDSDADADADSDSDADADTEVHPEISFAQAVCDDGGTSRWTFSATASDPQGLDTLNPEGTVEVFYGEESIGLHVLTLDVGQARFKATVGVDDVGVYCGASTDHDFSFMVSDLDGNESDPKIVTGEREE